MFPPTWQYPHIGYVLLKWKSKVYFEHLSSLSMIETIENTIIKNLIRNEDYTRKVLPFLKPDYFDKTTEKILFEESAKFIVEYDKCLQ